MCRHNYDELRLVARHYPPAGDLISKQLPPHYNQTTVHSMAFQGWHFKVGISTLVQHKFSAVLAHTKQYASPFPLQPHTHSYTHDKGWMNFTAPPLNTHYQPHMKLEP